MTLIVLCSLLLSWGLPPEGLVAAFVRAPGPRTDVSKTFSSSWRRPLVWLEAIAVGRHHDQLRQDRWDRTASRQAQSAQECVLQIDGQLYNMTAWAKAHPGGDKVLLRFHSKDATKAFHAAGHSSHAHDMLKDFAIENVAVESSTATVANKKVVESIRKSIPRWRQKLFTSEDPYFVHKGLGIFVLLNFIFRYAQMYFGDPTAGLGKRLGKGPGIASALCLVPHGLLSLSSLIFHTVPRERVVGRPMIWKEYRIHNISFGFRSVVTAFFSWLSIYKRHSPVWRKTAVIASCITVLAAMVVADEGTRRLRANDLESTTATMPYWEGCSLETQRRFKSYYAYCQFMATISCLTVSNPAWSLAVLFPIQIASLLLTLVRKGLVTARGWHVLYAGSLAMPYFVGLRAMLLTKDKFVPALFVIGLALYQLRRRGVNKYLLWAPVIAARAAVGDQFIPYANW